LCAFDFEKHNAEAKEKWGSTDAYREHAEKTRDYSKEKWNALAGDMDAIFAAFALCMKSGESSDSAHAQSLVKKLQDHISTNYYNCTCQILSGLGQMYVADARFKSNIDVHAAGTAEFVCAAIAGYCRKQA
jgi:hypothetical protein